MMKREWKAILGRYGRMVAVCTPGRKEEHVKVFLQPVLDKDTQIQPSPLGLRREERMLYLGPGEVELLPGESVVQDGQCRYEVRSTRVVEDGHHVWAVLQRMEDTV
jgi:hypothetical protein